MVDILAWILLGAFVGWIASMIMGTNEDQGAVGNIIVGIVGAFVGGLIVRLLTGSEASGFFSELIVALIGAIIVLAIYKAISRTPAKH